MPMELAVHARWCKWQTGECTCTPEMFTDAAAAVAAHGGDATRLQLVRATAPATNWRTKPDIPAHRSQARRHRSVISE